METPPLSQQQLDKLRYNAWHGKKLWAGVEQQPLLPLSETDLIAARKAEKAQEQRTIEKGRALWPDIRPESERRPDITDITRDIARGS